MPDRERARGVVAVFSTSAEEAEAVAAAVSALGVGCAVVLTAARLRETLVSTPCNGVLLSLPATVRLDSAGKALVRTIEQVYPVARVKRLPAGRGIAVMGTHGSTARNLPDFLAGCAAFAARCIRRVERVPRTLNVLLHRATGAPDPEETFTLDLSPGGGLVHSVREWRIGETVALSFLELPWDDPVVATVRHAFPWGIPFQPRGIGVRFDGMAPGHAENLRFLLYGKKG